MVWDELLPLMILFTYKDKIMKVINVPSIPSELAQVLVLDHAMVVVTLLEKEIQFCTYEGIEESDLFNMNGSEDGGFEYTGTTFSMKEMLGIKDLLLSMMSDYFTTNVGDFLKFTPTCLQRGRIYIAFLKKAGYTVIDYGDKDYLITYPY